MAANSRFVIATHVLAILAAAPGKPVCSSYIAESVNTNPVVIRRLMAMLEQANLVKSVAGRSGGFELARSAPAITLADIYRAVEESEMFRMHANPPSTRCPIGAAIAGVLTKPLRKAEDAMVGTLSSTRLSDVVAAIPH